MIRIPGGRTDIPDTQIAIINGQPELVVNLPMVAEMVKGSPLGLSAGFEAAVGYVGEQYRPRLSMLVFGTECS